ncbi:MAG: metal ABC transporter permease [Ignavibacteria bacterium]|nr:metal ABC transporter permease [Ignavibacteria bacterium]
MIDSLGLSFVQNALQIAVITGLLLAYIGVHVVRRGIVFVDLALGQISMLGVAAAAYVEADPTMIGILFTVLGAFLLSFLNVKDSRLKQEALIGIVYAVAAALTVLLISKAPHGEADFSEVMFGSFFTVSDERILITALVFLGIGVLHLFFRKQFFAVTKKFEEGGETATGLFDPWNAVFYLSLGLAIVLAVRVGGVIPVFAYIVVPPVAAILLSPRGRHVIVKALAVSVLASLSGIVFAVQFDFPAGPSVVSVLGALLLCGSLVRYFLLKRG